MRNLYNQYPVLDLHGFDRDYARIMINDFIRDCYIMKVSHAIIIHGVGSGVLRKTTQQTLKNNVYIEEARLDIFNGGQTIVRLKLH